MLTRSVSISANMQRETIPGHIEAVYPSETVGWCKSQPFIKEIFPLIKAFVYFRSSMNGNAYHPVDMR